MIKRFGKFIYRYIVTSFIALGIKSIFVFNAKDIIMTYIICFLVIYLLEVFKHDDKNY